MHLSQKLMKYSYMHNTQDNYKQFCFKGDEKECSNNYVSTTLGKKIPA